jgi:hypothetical protein
MYKSNPKNFTDQLLREISIILPVELDRLISEGPAQIDTSTPSEQLIIPLKIEATRDLSKRNADNLHRDLDVMIKHRKFTELDMNPHTAQLNETYGYKLQGELSYFILFMDLLTTAKVILYVIY